MVQEQNNKRPSDPSFNMKDTPKEVHHHVIDSLRKDYDIESIDYVVGL